MGNDGKLSGTEKSSSRGIVTISLFILCTVVSISRYKGPWQTANGRS